MALNNNAFDSDIAKSKSAVREYGSQADLKASEDQVNAQIINFREKARQLSERAKAREAKKNRVLTFTETPLTPEEDFQSRIAEILPVLPEASNHIQDNKKTGSEAERTVSADSAEAVNETENYREHQNIDLPTEPVSVSEESDPLSAEKESADSISRTEPESDSLFAPSQAERSAKQMFADLENLMAQFEHADVASLAGILGAANRGYLPIEPKGTSDPIPTNSNESASEGNAESIPEAVNEPALEGIAESTPEAKIKPAQECNTESTPEAKIEPALEDNVDTLSEAADEVSVRKTTEWTEDGEHGIPVRQQNDSQLQDELTLILENVQKGHAQLQDGILELRSGQVDLHSQLSQKIHSEGVQNYRNTQRLLQEDQQKIDSIEKKVDAVYPWKKLIIATLVLALLNGAGLVITILMNLGFIR